MLPTVSTTVPLMEWYWPVDLLQTGQLRRETKAVGSEEAYSG